MGILGQEENLKLIDVAVKKNLPVLLVGDTGCGKTTMVKQQAKKHKKNVMRFNLTGETTVDEFIGKYTLEEKKTVWKDGILLTAMKEGHWLVVDEINVALPEILFVLHALLDDDRAVTVTTHDSEVVTPHKDFRFFATMNPVEEYSGTKDLNKAFLSRFPMILDVDYPDQATEYAILKQEAGCDEKTAAVCAEVGIMLRRNKKENTIFYTCSTRDLIQWARLAGELGLGQAFKVTIGNKARADEKRINDVLEGVLTGFKRVQAATGITHLDQITKKFEELQRARAEFDASKLRLREDIIREIVGSFAEKAKV